MRSCENKFPSSLSEAGLVRDLKSQKLPLIKKAARKIRRERLLGFDEELTQALRFSLTKPRSWETQNELILSLAATDCVSQLPYLMELVEEDYQATVLYRSLGLAILYLQNKEQKDLSFLETALKSGNQNLFAGALLGLSQREVVLSHDEVEQIFTVAKQPVYLQNFKQVLSPIQLLLSMSYLFEAGEREAIIQYCEELDPAFFASFINGVRKNKKIQFL